MMIFFFLKLCPLLTFEATSALHGRSGTPGVHPRRDYFADVILLPFILWMLSASNIVTEQDSWAGSPELRLFKEYSRVWNDKLFFFNVYPNKELNILSLFILFEETKISICVCCSSPQPCKVG